jgi:hypothetical protein
MECTVVVVVVYSTVTFTASDCHQLIHQTLSDTERLALTSGPQQLGHAMPTQAHGHIHIHTHPDMHTQTDTGTHTQALYRTCTHTRTHSHTHIRTHTHIPNHWIQVSLNVFLLIESSKRMITFPGVGVRTSILLWKRPIVARLLRQEAPFTTTPWHTYSKQCLNNSHTNKNGQRLKPPKTWTVLQAQTNILLNSFYPLAIVYCSPSPTDYSHWLYAHPHVSTYSDTT